MNFRLLFKLATIPLRRSWVLLGLMLLSFAQVMLALWFCGGIQNEITNTQSYARDAHFMTVQLKEETTSVEPIRELFKDYDVSFEELKTEDVLKKMEIEEPEIVQTVRSTGNEGLQLMPRMLLVRGAFPEELVEKIKMMTDVFKVDVSPVHHARLLSFYKHLAFELRIAVFLILFLVLVQLLVFERIQQRDLADGLRNLMAWGAGGMWARFPGFLSLVVLSGASFAISLVEWIVFQKWVWNRNAFLGELSLDRVINLPYGLCFFTFLGIMAAGIVLNFSGRNAEE